jgi:hypothetical protein
MATTKDGVTPRSKIDVRIPPGAATPRPTPTPRSGVYEQAGPRGGMTGHQADSTRGNSLPPTHKPDQGWTLVRPTPHKK